jgi:hypothetical protein
MKQARPWMLANLKIICQFHAHPVHHNKLGARFFGPRYTGDDSFRVESSLIQSNSRSLRDLKGYLPRRKKNIVSMSEEIWSNLKIAICVKQANTMTFITIGFRVSVVSDVRERVRNLASPLRFVLRSSWLVESVSVLHGTCLQWAENKNISISMWRLEKTKFVKKS